MWWIVETDYNDTKNSLPGMTIGLSCELQQYRIAGDSPECWYINTLANSAGNIWGNW